VRSLQSANDTLTALGNQTQSLADVLARAGDPVLRTVNTARDTNQTVHQAQPPTSRIVDTLDSIDDHVANLGPLLDQTLSTSRSIETKLRILLLLPRQLTPGRLPTSAFPRTLPGLDAAYALTNWLGPRRGGSGFCSPASGDARPRWRLRQ
jgi:hypothetical protein